MLFMFSFEIFFVIDFALLGALPPLPLLFYLSQISFTVIDLKCDTLGWQGFVLNSILFINAYTSMSVLYKTTARLFRYFIYTT